MLPLAIELFSDLNACLPLSRLWVSHTAHCGSCARAGATGPKAGGALAYPAGGAGNAMVFSRGFRNATPFSSDTIREGVALHDGAKRVLTMTPRMHKVEIER